MYPNPTSFILSGPGLVFKLSLITSYSVFFYTELCTHFFAFLHYFWTFRSRLFYFFRGSSYSMSTNHPKD